MTYDYLADLAEDARKRQATMERIIGHTVTAVHGLARGSGKLRIETDAGTLVLHHLQSCCETVDIDDFEGDADDLIGRTVLFAEEVVNGHEAGHTGAQQPDYDSTTWTFYKFRTTGGDLWVRWLGTSNGCYSEDVDVEWEAAS